ncbi:unnamed protein product [Alternaria alternata]
MDRTAKLDMRLMCLDEGPDSPVILRKRPDAKYEVVGDAIVTGAMQGELWEKLRSEHVQDIEVV